MVVQYHSRNTTEPLLWGTPFASEKWPFKRGGLSSGVEINIFLFRFNLSSGLSMGFGLSSGWSLKRGSTVLLILLNISELSWMIIVLNLKGETHMMHSRMVEVDKIFISSLDLIGSHFLLITTIICRYKGVNDIKVTSQHSVSLSGINALPSDGARLFFCLSVGWPWSLILHLILYSKTHANITDAWRICNQRTQKIHRSKMINQYCE